MTVAQTRFMLQNEYAPGVGITEGAELNQAGAWGANSMGYVAVPVLSHLWPVGKRGVPMTPREKTAAYNAAYKAAGRRMAWNAANSDRLAEYSRKNTERMRAWRKSPEGMAYLAALNAKKRLAPEEKAERARVRAELNAARVKATLARAIAKRRARYSAEPELALRLRMSSAVRSALRNTSKSASWSALVGYSVADLRGHIERQFVRGMGWHNMPKWHVDHIVPLSSFKFQSADDPEFRAAWALTNLRPVWARENLRKQARREHLL